MVPEGHRLGWLHRPSAFGLTAGRWIVGSPHAALAESAPCTQVLQLQENGHGYRLRNDERRA